jgi:hypothetical protein
MLCGEINKIEIENAIDATRQIFPHKIKDQCNLLTPKRRNFPAKIRDLVTLVKRIKTPVSGVTMLFSVSTPISGVFIISPVYHPENRGLYSTSIKKV